MSDVDAELDRLIAKRAAEREQANRESEAHRLMIEAYRGLVESERSLPPGHGGFLDPDPVTDVLDRLVRLYNDSGRPADAARWRVELDARRPKSGSPAKK